MDIGHPKSWGSPSVMHPRRGGHLSQMLARSTRKLAQPRDSRRCSTQYHFDEPDALDLWLDHEHASSYPMNNQYLV